MTVDCAWGSVLEASERLVDRERLGHVLSELRTHVILAQTANSGDAKVSSGADGLGWSPSPLLELDERRVLAQVKSEQHGVCGLKTLIREVALGLLRLDAAESGELGLALRGIQDGLGTLLADVILKQAVSNGQACC